MNLPQDVIEAGRIDGATGLKLFNKIKLPLLMPSVLMVTIVTVIGSMSTRYFAAWAILSYRRLFASTIWSRMARSARRPASRAFRAAGRHVCVGEVTSKQ